jgi:hypothetical protein
LHLYLTQLQKSPTSSAAVLLSKMNAVSEFESGWALVNTALAGIPKNSALFMLSPTLLPGLQGVSVPLNKLLSEINDAVADERFQIASDLITRGVNLVQSNDPSISAQPLSLRSNG